MDTAAKNMKASTGCTLAELVAMTSTNAAKAYYDNLDASIKDFVVFEHSAHYPQFEEEALFADWLIKTWKSLEL